MEDAKLRAGAIWALGGMGMLLKHKQDVDITGCQPRMRFFCSKSQPTSQRASKSRRLSIAAMGDLQMKEAVPIVKALLADNRKSESPGNFTCGVQLHWRLSRARMLLKSLATCSMKRPTDPVCFLGLLLMLLVRTQSRASIPILVQNRMRLGDNLSVDNAIERQRDVVFRHSEVPRGSNACVSNSSNPITLARET